jgi:hypothetical protein
VVYAVSQAKLCIHFLHPSTEVNVQLKSSYFRGVEVQLLAFLTSALAEEEILATF